MAEAAVACWEFTPYGTNLNAGAHFRRAHSRLLRGSCLGAATLVLAQKIPVAPSDMAQRNGKTSEFDTRDRPILLAAPDRKNL